MVEFAEPGVSSVRLTVRAYVRPALAVKERDLAFTSATNDALSHCNFVVDNFSDTDWRSLTLAASEPWLSCTSRLLDGDVDEKPAPRQRWQCTVASCAKGLSPGLHQAKIKISAGGEQPCKAELPVRLRISPPIVLSPAQFFFGRVKSAAGSTTAKQTVLLVLAADLPQLDARLITLRHDVGNRLEVELQRQSGRVYEVTATLTPSANACQREIVSGKVVIAFSGQHGLAPVEVPLFARLENDR